MPKYMRIAAFLFTVIMIVSTIVMATEIEPAELTLYYMPFQRESWGPLDKEYLMDRAFYVLSVRDLDDEVLEAIQHVDLCYVKNTRFPDIWVYVVIRNDDDTVLTYGITKDDKQLMLVNDKWVYNIALYYDIVRSLLPMKEVDWYSNWVKSRVFTQCERV